MAARDRYSVPVSCTSCGTAGAVQVSENEYGFMQRQDRQVDQIEGSFDLVVCDDKSLQLRCKTCGQTVIAKV